MKIWWTALFQGSMYCALFEFCQFYIINHFLSFLSKRYTVAISFTIPILVLYVVQFQSWPFMLWNFSPGPFYVAEYNSNLNNTIIASKAHRHKAPASTASHNNNVLGKSKFDLITIPFDILNFLPSEL